jgi:hypothetical protein
MFLKVRRLIMGNKVDNAYINAKRFALQERDEATNRALDNYNESKKHADIVQKMSKKVAVDKATKNLVETTYTETVEQLEKIRDSIISEAIAVFNNIWDQTEAQYKASTVK